MQIFNIFLKFDLFNKMMYFNIIMIINIIFNIFLKCKVINIIYFNILLKMII